MHVSQLWRYPVKSLAGEQVSTLSLAADGVEGDRAWGILDRADGRILTGRREPPLLFATARSGSDGLPCITLPDGRELMGPGSATDEALSAWLGKPVTLVAAAQSEARRAEFFADATDDSSSAIEWTMPEGRFVDAEQLLVLTTAGLRGCAAAYPGGAWDVRRFRPNVLVEAEGEGFIEDQWIGRTLLIGGSRLAARSRCIRCTMVNRAQPGLARDVEIYRTLKRTHGGDAGAWSHVTQMGVLSLGDVVTVQ
jgi:uncharacterized protein YcbX